MTVHDELAALREQRDEIIRRGWENGELEWCKLETPSEGFVCHRGGIGCKRAHEDDPPELRYIERRTGRRPRVGLFR